MKTHQKVLAGFVCYVGGVAALGWDISTARDVTSEEVEIVAGQYHLPDEVWGRDSYRVKVRTAQGRIVEAPASHEVIGLAKAGARVTLHRRRSDLGIVDYQHVTP